MRTRRPPAAQVRRGRLVRTSHSPRLLCCLLETERGTSFGVPRLSHFPGGAAGPGAVLTSGSRVALAGRCSIEIAFFDIFVFVYIPADVII